MKTLQLESEGYIRAVQDWEQKWERQHLQQITMGRIFSKNDANLQNNQDIFQVSIITGEAIFTSFVTTRHTTLSFTTQFSPSSGSSFVFRFQS
jgi:hypothetical protein